MASGEARLEGVSARISALAAVMGAIALTVVRGGAPAAPAPHRCAAAGEESEPQAAPALAPRCASAMRLVSSPSASTWAALAAKAGASSA